MHLIAAAIVVAGAFASVPGLAFTVPTVGPIVASSTASVVVDDTTSQGPVNSNLFGTNYDIYSLNRKVDASTRQLWPSVTASAQHLGLHFVRMQPAINLQYCGGVDCTYHWMQSTPGTPDYRSGQHATKLSPDEWISNVEALTGGTASPMILVNIEAGTVAEAQDWVAYMNGSTTSGQLLSDATTVGKWAKIRAANGHAAPYGVKYWEIGNEEHTLHACPLSTSKNGPNCSNNTPADCVIYNNMTLYGCLVHDYGTAMKAVDANIAVVAGYGGGDFSPVHAKAAGVMSAIDFHEYPDTEVEPNGTTFDTDNQRADFTVSDTTSGALQPITFGLWVSASDPGHIDVYLDHGAFAVKSYTINASTSAIPYPISKTEALAGTHQHVLTVVGCSKSSVQSITGTCQPDGRHTQVYLQHITVSNGNLMATTMAAQVGCFLGPAGIPSTTVADTSVTTTSGHTGSGSSPGTPWRLAAGTDFPIAFAPGNAQVFGPVVGTQFSKLSYTRTGLAAAGFKSIPMIIGEYATWAGCDEVPTDLTSTLAAGIWNARILQVIYSDQSTAYPIIGASAYTLDGGSPMENCLTFHLLTTVLTDAKPCQGSDTAYLSPVGLSMAQFSSLAGNRAPATVTGGPVMESFPAGTQIAMNVPGVTAVASHSGTTTTVVLTNACPTSSQCGPGAVAASVSLQSGITLVAASATTVHGPTALSDNTDAAQSTVVQSPTTVATSGATATVTLPPLSVTTLTLATA